MAINIFTHIRRGLFDNVYNCIEKDKVDVNQRDDDTGNPPLVVAVEENQIEIVKLLLNRGADVNVKDWTSKNTALDISEQKLKLPIFYFCDWDNNGLNIYSQVRNIFNEKNKLVFNTFNYPNIAFFTKRWNLRWRSCFR